MANMSHPLMSSRCRRLSWVPQLPRAPEPDRGSSAVGGRREEELGGRNHQRGFNHQLASEKKKKNPCRHRLVPGVPGMLTAGWFLQAPLRLTRLPVSAIKKKQCLSPTVRTHTATCQHGLPNTDTSRGGKNKQTSKNGKKKKRVIFLPTTHPLCEKATGGLVAPWSTWRVRRSIPTTTLASLQYVLLGWEKSRYLIHITQRRTDTHFGLIFYWNAVLFPPF